MQGGCHVLLGMTALLCILHMVPRAQLLHSRLYPARRIETISSHHYEHKESRLWQLCSSLSRNLVGGEDPTKNLRAGHAASSEQWVSSLTLGFVKHTHAFFTFQNVSLLGTPHADILPPRMSQWPSGTSVIAQSSSTPL